MKRAVILVSGGLDSATVLAIARDEGWECHALSVDYGQRHRAELAAASRVAASGGVRGHRVVKVDLAAFGGSALTDPAIAVPHGPSKGIPVTYVPARNTILLALALAQAEVLGAEAIFIGANAVDYSGYPDCRPEFLEAFSVLARLATRRGVEGAPIEVRAPIVHLSKREIIERAAALGVDLQATVSCYEADASGHACGACEACRIRREGFQAAGLPDPTRYRVAVEHSSQGAS